MTEKTYVTQVEHLDASREIALANADSRYSIASLVAANQKNRDSFIASAAQREDRVAVRGIYETALHNRVKKVSGTVIVFRNPRCLFWVFHGVGVCFLGPGGRQYLTTIFHPRADNLALYLRALGQWNADERANAVYA